MGTLLIATLSVLLTVGQATGLRGTVVDRSGAAVPDATVVLLMNGAEQAVPVADDGTFVLSSAAGVLLVEE